jgi:hypothetical protein
MYRLFQKESDIPHKNVLWIKSHHYDQKHQYPKLNTNADNGEINLKSIQTATHLLITKHMHDFRLLLRCKRDLCSCAMLCSVDW